MSRVSQRAPREIARDPDHDVVIAAAILFEKRRSFRKNNIFGIVTRALTYVKRSRTTHSLCETGGCESRHTYRAHDRTPLITPHLSLLFSAAKTVETSSGAQLSDRHRLSYFSERSDARQRGNARYRTLALGHGSKLVRSVTACRAWPATDSGYRSPCRLRN